MEARKSPAWLKNAVMYQLFLRAFTPEGTLRAAEKKLPELASLGVDIVYLCPVCLQDDDMRKEFWSDRQTFSGTENPRNPYRIKDFYSVDPEYGTEANLRSFIATAHKLKIRVLLDIVFFHCGPTAGFIESHPDFVKRKPDGSVDYGLWHFPALNYNSEELKEYLLRNLEFWVNQCDVDGYRCDVADMIPLDFWEGARKRLEKLKPELIMLAEGNRKENTLLAFDMNYFFAWAFCLHSVFTRGEPVYRLRALAENQFAEYPAGSLCIRYFDNHDIAHDTSFGITRKHEQSERDWESNVKFMGIPYLGLPAGSRIESSWGFDACSSLLALCFALDGVPMLYNGQEIADSAPQSIYNRMPVNWAKGHTVEGKARRALVKRLCALRHSEKALTEGAVLWIDNVASERILSFVREAENEKIIVAINLSKIAARTGLSGDFVPLMVSKGASLEELPAYGFFIGKSAARTNQGE